MKGLTHNIFYRSKGKGKNFSTKLAEKKGFQQCLSMPEVEFEPEVSKNVSDIQHSEYTKVVSDNVNESEDAENVSDIGQQESEDVKNVPDIGQHKLEYSEEVSDMEHGFKNVSNIGNCAGDESGWSCSWINVEKASGIADCFEDRTWTDVSPMAVEENIVMISSAVVHLVDGEWSVEVGRGEFSIVRKNQQSAESAMIAKVGEYICWPISKAVLVLKPEKLRYLFCILTPATDVEAFQDTDDTVILSKFTPAEILNYLVSFPAQNDSSKLDFLDKFLEQDAQFSDSSSLNTDSSRPEGGGYNSVVAKAIAAGTGQLVKGLLFCSSAYSSNVQKGGKLLIDRMESHCELNHLMKSAHINPEVTRSIQRMKRLSIATENISENVVKGLHNLASGVLRNSVNQTKAGQKFFRTLPGEMLLVSLDSFNKIVGAVEEAGKDALISTSDVAADIVKHRFGESVGEVTKDTFAVAGHCISTAWNIARIRKLINPASSSAKGR